MGNTPVAPITILRGNDTLLRDRARQGIIEAITRASGPPTIERFDSATQSVEDFVGNAITPSMFGGVRVFSIRHVNALSDRDLTTLGSLGEYELPDVSVIIECSEAFKRKDEDNKVLKLLGVKERSARFPDRIAVLEFMRPPEYKVAEWLAQQAPALFGRSLAKAEADLLVDLIGPDSGILCSELQKIDIHLPEGKPFSRDAIERVAGASRQCSPFELAAALGERDFVRAMTIIDSLFTATFYAPPCVAAIFRHFWALKRTRAFGRANQNLMKRYTSGGGSFQEKNEIARTIGVAAGVMRPGDAPGRAFPTVVKARLVEQARCFKDEHFDRIFLWLRDYDTGIKTGRVEGNRHSFELLCFRIVRVVELADTVGV